MLDLKKRVRFSTDTGYTTGDLIRELENYPNVPICICGSPVGYIHVDIDEDGNPMGITLDSEDLEEEYDILDDEDE